MNTRLLAIHIDSATHRDTCPHRLHNRRQRRAARQAMACFVATGAALVMAHAWWGL